MTQEFDSITAREIVLKHPESNIRIRLVATKDGAGIWIGNDGFVVMQSLDNMICFAVGKHDQISGYPFAVSVDPQGEPVLQVCRPGGEAVIISGQQIVDMFNEVKRL